MFWEKAENPLQMFSRLWEKSGKFPGKMMLFAKNASENNTIVSWKIILFFPLQWQRRWP
jgi:hypothetical protein